MFELAPGAYKYRALRLTEPLQRGWDVYALQSALVGRGAQLHVDGYFGKVTDAAVRETQRQRLLAVDGVAGVITQRSLALWLAGQARNRHGLAKGLLNGLIEHESSYWFGNHTAPYANGHRDIGIVQRNTRFHPMEQGFRAESIDVCASHIKTYFDKYRGWGLKEPRSWRLAAGSWNAPAWSDRLASGQKLQPAQMAHIKAYMDAVTSYLSFD